MEESGDLCHSPSFHYLFSTFKNKEFIRVSYEKSRHKKILKEFYQRNWIIVQKKLINSASDSPE